MTKIYKILFRQTIWYIYLLTISFRLSSLFEWIHNSDYFISITFKHNKKNHHRAVKHFFYYEFDFESRVDHHRRSKLNE